MSPSEPLEPTTAAEPSGLHATLVRRPIGVVVVLVTLLVVGVISYLRLPLQMLPGGITGTRFTVMVNHPGSSAQENVEKVSRVLEEQFETLADVQDVWSTSDDDSVRLRVSFSGDGDGALAKAELRDRIERARPLLPETVERIWVWSNDDGDMPIMWFAVTASETVDGDDVDRLIEQRVQRALEAVDGVSRVNLWGTLADSVRILLDEDKVRAAQLNLGEVIQRLGRDNFAKPMGEVTDGERRFLLRSDMRFTELEEIADYPVGNGLRLGDIASVERVKSVRERLTRINGRYAYYGMVQKESSANVVEVGDRIEAVIAQLEHDPELDGALGVTVFFNQANFIRSSLRQLESTALWGGGLAVLILFLFLKRARTTLVVALSIPVSVVLALAWEYFSGGSFNVLTMTGLTLALGMLVDNSVVVIENISRLRAMGRSPLRAAVEGAQDVGLAVALATLTSVVVFLPLIFMIGNQRMRVFLAAMGVPLCTALLFSLVVAVFFLPVLAARVMGDRPRWVDALGRGTARVVSLPMRGLAHGVGLGRRVAHGLTWSAFWCVRGSLRVLTPLRWPLALGLVALAVQSWRVRSGAATDTAGLGEFGLQGLSAPSPTGFLGVALGVGLLLVGLPRWRRRADSPPAAPLHFAPPGSSALDWIQDANRGLLAWTLEHRFLTALIGLAVVASVQVPMGNMTVSSFGEDEDQTELEVDVELERNFTLAEASREMARYEEVLEGFREELGFENLVVRFWAGGGEIGLRWLERQDPKDLDRLRERLRRELPKLPGHRLRFGAQQEMGATNRQTLSFQIRGPEADALDALGEQAVEILARVPGLSDVRSPLEEAPEEVRVMFDRETAFAMGVSSQNAVQNVSWALRGASLPRFQERGREVPFLIEYDQEQVAGLDTLRDLSMWTGEGQVALTSFAQLTFRPGARSIFRWNGMTTTSVQARISDPARMGELTKAGYDALEAELELPRGFSLGRDQSAFAEAQQEQRDLINAMLLSVVLVFLLMAILFESLTLPWAVLVTIPFAFVGAMWTLFTTGTTMDSVGWIGIIILVGVVVNNGIVLVDKIHRLRKDEGLERSAAVLEGGSARVRPILMTALTTVFGLLPMTMAKATNEGIDYRALATCVAGGLTVSTFFTLWMVPWAYLFVDDLTQAGKRVLLRAFRASGRAGRVRARRASRTPASEAGPAGA